MKLASNTNFEELDFVLANVSMIDFIQYRCQKFDESDQMYKCMKQLPAWVPLEDNLIRIATRA